MRSAELSVSWGERRWSLLPRVCFDVTKLLHSLLYLSLGSVALLATATAGILKSQHRLTYWGSTVNDSGAEKCPQGVILMPHIPG